MRPLDVPATAPASQFHCFYCRPILPATAEAHNFVASTSPSLRHVSPGECGRENVNRSTERLGLSMRTVKRHICNDHLVHFILCHDGIAEYLEDWLEQIHQTYKKFSNRADFRDKKAISIRDETGGYQSQH
jgi:hypothetical protein